MPKTGIEEEIFKKYAELRVINQNICRECNAKKSIENAGHPISFFVKGEKFDEQKFKVMFVGKSVRTGWEKDLLDPESDFIDAREGAKREFLPFWGISPFWQCIKRICQVLWEINDADEIWRRIAITNLVKCSISPGLDRTTQLLKNNCILKAGFFKMEVNEVLPTHLVFFTGPYYDEHIKKVISTFEYNEDLQPVDKDPKIGRWWIGEFGMEKEVRMRFLRTYHPTYFRFKEDEQEDFCQHIAAWIKEK